MKPKFEISVLTVSRSQQLPGTWSEDDCLRLLQHLEFDGADALAPAERRDYAIMALQDKEDVEAASQLIEFGIGDRLNRGRKQNLAEEMTTDRAWEEFADLSLHEAIFNAQVMLSAAFPSVPSPEIYQIALRLKPLNPAATHYLGDLPTGAAGPALPETVLLRALASAMPTDAIINRLFEDQVAGQPFPEAEHILWQIQSTVDADQGLQISLYSPIRWMTPLEEDMTAEVEPFIEDLED